MSKQMRKITRDDLMDIAEFAKERVARRKDLLVTKKLRRIALGPDATFYFETYDTMWSQVMEMLYIEKGGEAQIADELSAYNPLIPQGRELVATLMFEINDEVRRAKVLGALGGVEETVYLQVGDEKIIARAEEDVDRTSAAGKASSVQFVHFNFTDAQVAAFNDPDCQVILGIGHPSYAHMTSLTPESRAELARDFA